MLGSRRILGLGRCARASLGVGTDGLGQWDPFDVATVERLLAGADLVWWLSGGVALDVFLQHATRVHGDIDVSIRRSDWLSWRRVFEGRLDIRTARDGVLSELDDQALDAGVHGLWAREVRGGSWRLQLNLEPVEGTSWIYRRDPRIRRPLDEVVWWRGSLPYVNPAVQLLWKARDATAKDQMDFTAVCPSLPQREQQWLADAIALTCPTSEWIAKLGSGEHAAGDIP